jgi:hypothetical protein
MLNVGDIAPDFELESELGSFKLSQCLRVALRRDQDKKWY